MDAASQYGSALNISDKLRSFLDALKTRLTGSKRSNLGRRSEVFADVGGDVTPGLMQYLDLLDAVYYQRRGTPRAFCRVVCSLMAEWAEAEEREGLEEEELEEELFSKWGLSGYGGSVIPGKLTEAMRPEYKATMDYATDYLLGDSTPRAISNGLRLAKVLTGAYAVQVYLHTREASEAPDDDLADLDLVDLSSLDLPDGWKEYLEQASLKEGKCKASPAKVPAERAASRVGQVTCHGCGKVFASRNSLSNHKRARCSTVAKNSGGDSQGPEPPGKSEASAVDVESDDDRTVRRVLQKKARACASDSAVPSGTKGCPEDEVAADVARALKAMLAKGIKAGARLLTADEV